MQGQKTLDDGLKGVEDFLFLEGQRGMGSSSSLQFIFESGFDFGQEVALAVSDGSDECGEVWECFWEGRVGAFMVVVDGPGRPMEEEDLCGLECEDGKVGGEGGHRKNYLLIISSINSYSPNAFRMGGREEEERN